MKNTIALCGLMGSGKSTVGRLLAQVLGGSFTDLDEVIEEQEKKTITRIFSEKGEPYFRQAESKALVKLLAPHSPGVIALGGGTVCSLQNLDLIKKNAWLVYLQADPAELWLRLQNDSGRPLLNTRNDVSIKQTLEQLLQDRKSQYESAHIIVNTVNLSPAQIADRIAALVREKNH